MQRVLLKIRIHRLCKARYIKYNSGDNKPCLAIIAIGLCKNMQTSKSLHQMSWLVYCDFNRSVCFKSYIVKKVSLTQGQLSFKAVKMGRLENILPLRSTQHFVVLFLLLQGKKYHNIVMDSQKGKLRYIIH